nr:diguanylate cyclase [Cohnella mopanensis]
MRRNDWRLASLYICTIGLFLVVSIFNFMSFRGISDTTNKLTRHTYPMDHIVNQLLLAVVNQENGIRGYLLTKDSTYLEPYEQGKAEVDKVKQQLLEEGSQTSAYEDEIVNALASLANVEFFFERVNKLIKDKQLEEAVSLFNDGQVDMKLFRDSVHKLELNVTGTMEGAWSDQQKRANYSMVLILMGAIVSLIAIMATWVMFRTTKNALRGTFESERRYRRLVDHFPDAIAIHQDGKVVFANPACAKLMGVSDSSQLLGMPMMQFVHEPYVKAVNDRAQMALREKDVGTMDQQFVKLDGSLVDVDVTAIGFSYGGRPAVLIVAREVGTRKEAERKMKEANALLQRLSTLDGLTDIPNRRSFDQDIHTLWDLTQDKDKQNSLILFDVDNFKAYNDHYGHQAGDACLQMVARIAGEVAEQAGGTVYRYGGEEFAVLLPEHDRERALNSAEQLRQAIANCIIPHKGVSTDAIVTISVGVATWNSTWKQTPAQWLQAADLALYQAKNQGRNLISEAGLPVS